MRALRDRGEKHAQDIERGDYRGHADRIAAHPRHRTIIIGGSDSEHAAIDSRRFLHASDVRSARKNSWRTARTGRNSASARFYQDRHLYIMKNIAPAISPPSGIGNNKPANQAVLDWVHEVKLLAKPEKIFWSDGSHRDRD